VRRLDNGYRAIWQRDIVPGSLRAYALGTLCVAIASVARVGLDLIANDSQVYTTFYPAIVLATLLGGINVGVFATLLSGAITWLLFMAPHYAPLSRTFGQVVSLSIYLFASAIIIWAAEHYRELTKRLKDEEHFRRLAVGELAHRLKNKIATIQSVIAFQLRDNPKIKDAIISRLAALSATDDLIISAQGQGAHLRDILSAELGPYEASRVSISGPALLLPPPLAMTMAMLSHELATNAAKYGSLSSPTGTVSINWSLSGAHLELYWRESGGPAVTAPTHRGFGTRLLSRALDQYRGSVETTFGPTGLICKMSAVIPKDISNIGDDLLNNSTEIRSAAE
jgi:two-component sensor histidine kinase